ncbi:MAG: 2-phosphosulfolactate phosphatase [Bacillota bacterium]|nr:MAG: 2-phosphosulfolactate phosphatase [Bacillota bacterium]MBS3950546.1 2-phosphosulfolactate phosphatase [Peptococcaceae bacterium]
MLKIYVASTPHELPLVTDMAQYTAVVIDALRATSTITTALHNGCGRIFPVSTVAEAAALKEQMPHALLAGERQGAKLSGYDLGNSPFEYAPEAIAGREVIFTTSNGTRTLVACESAGLVVVASFLNRSAVAKAVQATGRDILIACAGHHGKLAAEDLACAGAIIVTFIEHQAYQLTDGALAALAIYGAWHDSLPALLGQSFSGRNVASLGYEDDIAYCAQLDVFNVVPIYQSKQITAS